MKKFLTIALLLIFFFTANCGFKAIDQSEITNFDIAEIETAGNSIINFKLKNKLQFNSKNNDKELIKILLNTTKNRKVKERNIKNQITKYEIEISVNVSVNVINKKISKEFITNKIGSYNVNKQHSITIRNEKKLIELLTDDLSDEILYELRSILNDI